MYSRDKALLVCSEGSIGRGGGIGGVCDSMGLEKLMLWTVAMAAGCNV